MQKFWVCLDIEFEFSVIAYNGFFGDLDGSLFVRNDVALAFF